MTGYQSRRGSLRVDLSRPNRSQGFPEPAARSSQTCLAGSTRFGFSGAPALGQAERKSVTRCPVWLVSRCSWARTCSPELVNQRSGSSVRTRLRPAAATATFSGFVAEDTPD